MTRRLVNPVGAEPAGAAADPVADGGEDGHPRSGPPHRPPPPAGESPLRSALSVLGTIGPPLTIATSLMIYFGWARSNQQARMMGLDVSLFGYTTQDYVLMSINTLFIPLMILAAAGLAALALHHRIEVRLRLPTAHRRLELGGRLALGGGLLLAAGAVTPFILGAPGPGAQLVLPLMLAVAIAVSSYGTWLADAARNLAKGQQSWSPAQRALRALLVSGLIGLAVFWAMSSYADVVGRGYAERIGEQIAQRPRVTAFSTAPLGLEAPGVVETQIADAAADDADGALRYRTTGLRLLTRAGGRLFLLHDGWTPEQGTVIVLPDDDTVRWQFSR